MIFILIATVTSCPAKEFTDAQTTPEQWSGEIRIEGKNNTIWKGNVAVGQVFFNATNVDTATIQEYNISYPSALGALIEASNLGDFSYSIDYYPSWNAFIVTAIDQAHTRCMKIMLMPGCWIQNLSLSIFFKPELLSTVVFHKRSDPFLSLSVVEDTLTYPFGCRLSFQIMIQVLFHF